MRGINLTKLNPVQNKNEANTHGTAEGIPNHVIVPGFEFVPSMLVKVLRGPEVEVRIELSFH